RYKFYEAIEHDPPMINEQSGNKLFELLILEKDVINFEKYVFPTNRDIIISNALIVMEQYLGTPYKFGGGESKTSLDSTGTAEMDCSEFMCRFLQELGIFTDVPLISTSMISDDKSFEKTQYGEKLEFIGGDKGDPDFIPKPGDVFIWSRSNTDGHTGVVFDYLPDQDQVVVIESIGNGNEDGYCSSQQNSLNSSRGCGKVVKSTYTRKGGALYSHDGWVGYYRPLIQ
ncbi:MAG: CHAP domain-containing protein, partial [Bacteroidales bacterium]|nr:CHAP domain-containing protein [Bacteroidales bacterium]